MLIKHGQPAKLINKDSFVRDNHYYPKVLHAQIHQMVRHFFTMNSDRIIERYCHLHPQVDKAVLKDWLSYKPMQMQWSGSDLFQVTTEKGEKQMIIIETNSSPSGQKSMPMFDDESEMGGYRRLMEQSFLPYVASKRTVAGAYAIVYDKNEMEASGYAATLAHLVSDAVYLVSFYNGDSNPAVRFNDEIMQVRDEEGQWHDIKAAFRYVTQKPWNRIPVKTKTVIYNPVIACLAGGRNKRMAAKAYELFNAQLLGANLKILTPETINNVKFSEVPIWVERFGGHAVVKNPYSNAGQGVYTITSPRELDDFMAAKHDYDDFIVQSLIGNYNWSSKTSDFQYYHTGMMPNRKNEIYVADIRFMIASSEQGFLPVAIYARRAAQQLQEHLDSGSDSWKMLGTNLSVKTQEGWDSETARLKLMDTIDFNELGLCLDSLIEGYIQSVLATIAIDRMAIRLLGSRKTLKRKLFDGINGDPILSQEILQD